MGKKRDLSSAFPGAIPEIKPIKHTVTVSISVETAWHIVVVGTIDFRQHNPLWYKLIGAIDESEQKQSEKSFAVLSTGGFRFDAGPFVIECIPDRWVITTKEKQSRARIVEVACLVFKKLWEISILAFGVNAQIVIPTDLEDVQMFLAEKMRGTALGFPDWSGKSDSHFGYKMIGDSSSTAIQVLGAPSGTKDILMFFNRERPIPKQEGYYDVGEMIRPVAEPDWMEADSLAGAIKSKTEAR